MVRRIDMALVLLSGATHWSSAEGLAHAAPRTLDVEVRSAIIEVGAARAAVANAPALRVTVPQPLALGAAAEPIEEAVPVCIPHWGPMVHDDIDKCIAGDAEGCVGIGDEYKNGCDSFSSIKWYRRGCRLGSGDACSELAKLGEPTPPPAN